MSDLTKMKNNISIVSCSKLTRRISAVIRGAQAPIPLVGLEQRVTAEVFSCLNPAESWFPRQRDISHQFNFRGTFTLCYPDLHGNLKHPLVDEGFSDEARIIKNDPRGDQSHLSETPNVLQRLTSTSCREERVTMSNKKRIRLELKWQREKEEQKKALKAIRKISKMNKEFKNVIHGL